MVRSTQHDRFLDQDYSRLQGLGILGVRESVPWYRIDRGGRFDFRPVEPFVAAGQRYGLTQIWDLFHYGFPPHLDPFEPDFTRHFADYCHAFARYLMRKTGREGTRFYTPVNELSFYAWAGGEVGWFAPFQRGQGFELKLQLARAAIAGIDAIRAADPGARMVNVDPICNAVAPLDAPELAEDAVAFNQFQWQGWDMLEREGVARPGREPPSPGRDRGQLLPQRAVGALPGHHPGVRRPPAQAVLRDAAQRGPALPRAHHLHHRDGVLAGSPPALAAGRHGQRPAGAPAGRGRAGDLPLPHRGHAGLAHPAVDEVRAVGRGGGAGRLAPGHLQAPAGRGAPDAAPPPRCRPGSAGAQGRRAESGPLRARRGAGQEA